MPTQWSHIDTFSGIGGFALAAAWTGRIQTVQFVEIDPWCRRVLAKHWPGVPQHDDIRTFLADAHGKGVPERQASRSGFTVPTGNGTRNVPEHIDLLTGGFPCQPWSAAGKRAGTADDRDLWPELHRVVVSVRPRWLLLENVPGIIRMAGGLERIQPDLEASGYEVGITVIPAAAVGAYHRRDRVWIIAHDVSVSDAERRGWRAHDEGQASPGRNGHTQAGDDGHAPLLLGQAIERDQPNAALQLDGGQRREDAADVGITGLEGRKSDRESTLTADGSRNGSEQGQETLSPVGLCADGLPARLLRRPTFGPDWEDGIPRVTEREVDRVNKLKALGNAIVPQVAYELMMMMLAVDDERMR